MRISRTIGPMLALAAVLAAPVGPANASERNEVERPETATPERAAAARLGPGAGLPELIRYAQSHAPSVQAVAARHRAALEAAVGAGALPDPRADLQVAAVPVETRVGPQHGRLGLSQTFPGPGKRRALTALAEAEAGIAAGELDRERARVAFGVADLYFEAYFLDRSRAVTRDNRDLLVFLEQVVRKAYENGRAPYADLIRAQVEIGRLENDLRSLDDRRRSVRARLNAALHRPVDARLPEPVLGETLPVLLPEDRIRALAAEATPDLAVIDAALERDHRAVEVADIQQRPDWTVSLAWMPTGDALLPGTPDSGRDPLVVGVSVNLPLWQGRYRADKRRARAARDATELGRLAVEDDLRDRVEQALFAFRNAEREAALYRDTLLPKAEQSFEASQAGLRAGTITVLDLVDAQRVLLSFQLAYERALAEAARRAAELESLLGSRVTAAPGLLTEEGGMS